MKLDFPSPSDDALRQSLKLIDGLKQKIKDSGPLSFYEYMRQALYAPGLGYYSGGGYKIGPTGDFVTAPEISPLFARCLARQCRQILTALKRPFIMELGAGLGTLSADLLLALEQLDSLPVEYWILETSGDLKQRQVLLLEQRCPHLLPRVKWLNGLPAQDFEGIILGNEVIDALPVSRFKVKSGKVMEMAVSFNGQKFQWSEMSASPLLTGKVANIQKTTGPLPEDFCSEVNLYLTEWLRSVSHHLKKGIMIWIDYGYPRSVYYQPSRSDGTLMCYYRHRAHPDPFSYPGLQDITAHVDFTALAEAGLESGFELRGYTSQATFLINCGLEQCLLEDPPKNISEQAKIKKLLLPRQMGESFKVMALGRDMDVALLGFLNSSESHKL